MTIALEPFERAVSGSVIVRRGRTPLGRATFRARAGDPVLARARLTAAARRLLARGQLSVRLVATARAGDESVSRFSAATLLRPRA